MGRTLSLSLVGSNDRTTRSPFRDSHSFSWLIARMLMIAGGEGEGAMAVTVVEDENPFGFLRASTFSLPSPSPIDPFRNHTPSMGVYEWCKVVFCLPITLVWLVLFGFALAFSYLATKIAL